MGGKDIFGPGFFWGVGAKTFFTSEYGEGGETFLKRNWGDLAFFGQSEMGGETFLSPN